MGSTIRSLMVKIGADLRPFESAMKKLEYQMNRTGRTLQNAGSVLTKGITMPLVGIGVAAFKTGKDFETSMSKIEGLVGIAKEQIDDWSKDIIKMAPKLGKAPTELGDGLFYVTSAGFRGAAAMEVLETAAKGSAAGLGDVSTIADTLTSAINAYGQENLSAGRSMDILTAAVREGKLEAASLAPVMGQLLPTASALDIQFSQMAGTLAVMSRTGSEAAESATSLNAIMLFLQKPSEEARQMLDNVGISMADLRDMAAQEPDGLIKVMRLLESSFKDDDEALAKIIPNVRAFRGVMNVLAQDASIVDDIMNNVTNSTGMANTAFEVAAETTEFKWQQAISGLQASLASLWETLQKTIVPIMEKVSGKIQEITVKFNQLDEKQKNNIVKWAGIAAAIGPVLLITGKLLISIPKLTKAVRLLGKSAIGLINPMTLAVAGLTAMGVGATLSATKFTRLKKSIEETTKVTIEGIEDQKQQTIKGYEDMIEAKKTSLDAELKLIRQQSEETISELEAQKADRIRLEKERLDETISMAETEYDEKINMIREEYGYLESATKSKTNVTNEYYDNVKAKANEAYNEAIKLINEELAMQLKLLDDETRAKVETIQEKIDGINKLTEQEEKELKKQTEAKKLAALEEAVQHAYLAKDKAKAQEELNEYLAELERNKILEERQMQIENLEAEIESIKQSREKKAAELELEAEKAREIEEEKLQTSLTNIELKRDAAIAAIQAEREEEEQAALDAYQEKVDSLESEKELIDEGTAHFIDSLNAEIEELKLAEAEKLTIREAANKEQLKQYTDMYNEMADIAFRDAEFAKLEAERAGEKEYREKATTKEAMKIKWYDVLAGPLSSVAKIPNIIKGIKNDIETNKIEKAGQLPSFDKGGIVEGPIGRPTLAIVHGGEQIMPHGGNSSGDGPMIVVNATYNIKDKATAEYASNHLVRTMQLRGVGVGQR